MHWIENQVLDFFSVHFSYYVAFLLHKNILIYLQNIWLLTYWKVGNFRLNFDAENKNKKQTIQNVLALKC